MDPLRSNPSTASAILDANDDARRVEASVNGAAGISGARVREPGAHPGVGEGLAGRTAGSNPGGSSDDRQTVGQVADARSILRAVVRVLGRVLEGDPSTLGRILRAMADEVPGIGALLGPDGTEATRDRLEPTG